MARTGAKKGEKKTLGPKAIETTINLHKRLHGVSFKNRAPRAVREIKKFAAALMSTRDVRVDADVNKFVWSKGVRNVPFRVRVRLERRRNEEEDGADKMVTFVEFVDVAPLEGGRKPSFKGLATKAIKESDE